MSRNFYLIHLIPTDNLQHVIFLHARFRNLPAPCVIRLLDLLGYSNPVDWCRPFYLDRLDTAEGDQGILGPPEAGLVEDETRAERA